MAEDAAIFFCSSANLEYRDLKLNEPLLKEIASRAGGEYVLPDKALAIADKLAKAAHEETTYVARSLWDNWVVWSVILGLLGLEWLFRRRAGLP